MMYRIVHVQATGDWSYHAPVYQCNREVATTYVETDAKNPDTFPLTLAVSREDLIVCVVPRGLEFLLGWTIAQAAVWIHEANEANLDFTGYSIADLADLAQAF